MTIGTDHFTQGGGKYRCIRECFFGPIDHALEAFDLGCKSFAAGFRTFQAEAELEVFFVTDQDIRKAGNFGEDIVQLFFAVDPERSAMVQVKRNEGAMLLGGAGDIQAELARLRRKCGNQPGQVM